MRSLADATWNDIQELHGLFSDNAGEPSLELKARQLTTTFVERFESVVLARLFIVLPASSLDPHAESFLAAHYPDERRLRKTTSVLTLLATAGREKAWNDRLASAGHLAIPLLDASFVAGIPMVTRLLSELETDLSQLDSGLPIVSRKLLGGQNGTFFVPDAAGVMDKAGRAVISNVPFVEKYAVKTVFGMGGAYLDGTIVAAIIFTNELLPRVVVDRFPSLIGSFKIATSAAQRRGELFAR